MDKFIYVAIGVGALVVAAVDQVGEGAHEDAAVPQRFSAPQSPVSNPSDASPSVEYAPNFVQQPNIDQAFNPIPRAEDLGGRVIEDRFQSDG